MNVRSTLPSILVTLFACSDASVSSEADRVLPQDAFASSACTEVGATTCEGLQQRVCDGVAWSEALDCDDGQICKDDTCRDLKDEEIAQSEGLNALLVNSRDYGALSQPVDYPALGAALRTSLLLGDGSYRSYVRVLWQGMLALPQGHQSLAPTERDSPEAYDAAGFTLGGYSRYGMCLRPSRDGLVVTWTDGSAVLERGDEIIAVDGNTGTDLVDWLIAEPGGGDKVAPTQAGRIAFATRAFTSAEREGTTLRVRRASEELEVTLPAARPFTEEDIVYCNDAFARVAGSGTLLPDGTGLLFIPSFMHTRATVDQELGPEFDKIRNAPRLVIDLRGNAGGYLEIALYLVGQLPGAKKTDYIEFFERRPESSPVKYVRAGVRRVDPKKIVQPHRFGYSGKVAFLIDGASMSSAEHMVLAARAATNVLVVGTPSVGAFGYIGSDVKLDLGGSTPVSVTMNRVQTRTTDGTVLDGTSIVPDFEVGYEPAAIARGEDPMLARAIAELSK